MLLRMQIVQVGYDSRPAYVLVYHFTQDDLDHGDAQAVIKSALAA